ncbi:MAG: cupin domain-containing protein, partial [Bacteroidetes bacterium]|nr:cupin domain-containing protein [Bacteroidota bacterium]
MGNIKTPVSIIADKTGRALSIAGGSYRIVATGDDTGGAYGIIEMLVPPGGGPGPHAHPDFEETFHVLEGEVEFHSEDGRAIAHKGDFVRIPKGGIVHGFKNKSDHLAR